MRCAGCGHQESNHTTGHGVAGECCSGLCDCLSFVQPQLVNHSDFEALRLSRAVVLALTQGRMPHRTVLDAAVEALNRCRTLRQAGVQQIGQVSDADVQGSTPVPDEGGAL